MMVLRAVVPAAVTSALLFWARAAEHNIGLPVYGGPVLGSVFTICGGVLLLAGLQEHLLPWIPHSVLTGFVVSCLGVSMICGSAAGLWLVTPVTALAGAVFVLGYQRHRIVQRRI